MLGRKVVRVGIGIGEKIQCLSLWLMHKAMMLSHEMGATKDSFAWAWRRGCFWQ